MQLQLRSHLDARARTTLKDIMSHRERHHGSSLHNDTAPQRKSLINTYTKSQSQFNRTEMGCAPRRCKDHSLPNKKTITQTHTQTHRHTHKSLHHHRNHKHIGVTLRKVTHRSITHLHQKKHTETARTHIPVITSFGHRLRSASLAYQCATPVDSATNSRRGKAGPSA